MAIPSNSSNETPSTILIYRNQIRKFIQGSLSCKYKLRNIECSINSVLNELPVGLLIVISRKLIMQRETVFYAVECLYLPPTIRILLFTDEDIIQLA